MIDKIKIWWKSKNMLTRFLLGFIILMLLFYAFYLSPLYEDVIMIPLLSIQAYLANLFLLPLGYKTMTMQDTIFNNDFRVSIKGGCDGMEATALYIAAVLAFPNVSRQKKIRGLVMGVSILFILNLFRIAGLFIAGLKWKSGFEFLHLHGGVIIFTLMAIVLWLIWVNSLLKTDNAAVK